MNARRRLLLSLGAVALGTPIPSFAQQPKTLPTIGVLRPPSASDVYYQAFVRSLAEYGYVDGKTIQIHHMMGDVDRLPALAEELVRLNVSLIFAPTPQAAHAARKVTSTVPIDHFNGMAAATSYLSDHHPDAAISVITRAEVLTGFESRAAKKAVQFLDCFPTLGIDQAIADLAATLRRDHGWRLPDAFQAAIAQQHGLKLVTRNQRDFPPQRYRFVVIPYRA